MTIFRSSKNRGSGLRGWRRARSTSLLLTAGLLGSLGVLAPSPAPAGADTITTQASLNLTCTANAPIVGTQVVEQALTIDIDHPDKIARNSTETLVISQPPLTVPSDVSGYDMIHLKNLSVAFKVPAQFRIDSAEVVPKALDPGVQRAVAEVAYSPSGDASLTIPGPLAGGQTYQIDELRVTLRAVGTPGTVGNVHFTSFNLTARAQLPVVGASDIPTVCPTPSPNPPMFGIEVAPGSFSTDPDPVVSTATINQPVVPRLLTAGLFSNSQSTLAQANVPISITADHLPEATPGEDLSINVNIGSMDWSAPFTGSPYTTASTTGANRSMRGFRNVKLELGGPDTAIFEVVSVTSANPAELTATYNAATNRILLSRPNNVETLGAALTMPKVTVVVRPKVSGVPAQTSTLTFEKATFDLLYQTSFTALGSSSNRTATATTQGPNPGGAPVGTQPDNSLYFRQTQGGQVITTFGVAVSPGANPDAATVANNESVEIDLLANDVAGTDPFDPATLTIVDEPSEGTVEVDPVTGKATYTPTYGTLAKSDGFTYAVKDTEGRWSNVTSVNITIVGIYCEAPCALDQTILVDVHGDNLTLAQANGSTVLNTVYLDGSAQWTTGPLQELTVTNSRGSAAGWSLTGQLESDFRASDSDPACPAGSPSTWDWKCIPGDNLGWEPMASVAHDVVPGDVAAVTAGPASTSGLRSAAQSLCSTADTHAGGTFSCGAVLSLGVPASAAAQGYSATITLTLA